MSATGFPTLCNSPDVEVLWDQEQETGWPKVVDIYFEDNQTFAFPWEKAITIEEAGHYNLWFVTCDPELAGAQVQGNVTFRDAILNKQEPDSAWRSMLWTLSTLWKLALKFRFLRHFVHC